MRIHLKYVTSSCSTPRFRIRLNRTQLNSNTYPNVKAQLMNLSKIVLTAALVIGSTLSVSANAKTAEKHPGMDALALAAADGDKELAERFNTLLEKGVYQKSIIDAITRPAEAKPWKAYRPIFMTSERISEGVKFWQTHAALLTAVQARYEVPAEYIVAIIGVETFYGRNVGKYKVLDALTTLGLYYPPRQPFFSGELKQLLKFSEQTKYKVDPLSAVGSYAGAMGMGQFMPSSTANFAVDGDEDGQVDMWNSKADVFASIANYFIGHGWEPGGPVLRVASVQRNARAIKEPGLLPVFPVSQLRDWGYHLRSGVKPAPADDRLASLVVLEAENGPQTMMVFQNFYTITRYNRSPLYATAVHQLAQAIGKQYRAASKPIAKP